MDIFLFVAPLILDWDDNMTKDFYTNFLSYISPKELKKLYSNLCKQKLSVNGYTPPKTPKAMLLAPLIAKNEKAFFNVLEKFYTPSFDNCDDATSAFAPDTAVTCLTYLVNSGMTNETSLMSLLEKKDDIREEIQASSETGKAKKKAEEFREKYLSTRRELLQLRDDYKKLQAENTELKSELSTETNRLHLAKEALRQFEEESESTITQLKSRVSELENAIVAYQPADTIQAAPILIVMDTDETDELGVDMLTYDNILKLLEIADRYDKILLVINDLPFSAKRKIQKIDAIQEKLVTFSTKQEMLEYAKQWRNG